MDVSNRLRCDHCGGVVIPNEDLTRMTVKHRDGQEIKYIFCKPSHKNKWVNERLRELGGEQK